MKELGRGTQPDCLQTKRPNRALLSLLVAATIFVTGHAGYSQVNINCGLSTPLGPTGHAASSGHTEPIAAGPQGVPPTPGGGVLRVTCTNNGGTVNPGLVTLTVSLGVPITNTASHPNAAAGIRIGTGGNGASAPTGDFSSPNVNIASINNSAGTIAIALGTPAGNPDTGITFTGGGTSTFDLAGVLVSTYGRIDPVTVSLLSSGGVNAAAGATTVINSIQATLKDPTATHAVLTSEGGNVNGSFTVRVEENFADMFKESNQFNGGGFPGGVFPPSPSSDTQVIFRFDNLPLGLSIANCVVKITDINGTTTSGTPSVNVTALIFSPLLIVNFNSPLDLGAVDVLWLTCSVEQGSAVLPLPATPVTVQVGLAPTGSALGASGNPLTGLTTGQVPRYQLQLMPASPVPVIQFPQDCAAVPTPVITGISPAFGGQGTTAKATVTGTNLGGISFIFFSGSGITATVLGGSDTSLLLSLNISSQAETGTRTVTAFYGCGSSAPFSGYSVKTQPLITTWGSNTVNQLGRTNPQSNLTAASVVGLTLGSGIVSIVAGGSHTLALKSDGAVLGWGSNGGALGDGTTTSRLVPTQVSGLGAGSGVVAIAAGAGYSLALKSDGAVMAWGSNSTNQLGDGTTTSRLTPVQVSGLGTGSAVVAIAVSSGIFPHSLALKSDGTVLTWGSNASGQLGDGTTIQRSTPVQVIAAGSGVVDISAGTSYSLARKQDGSVLAWGTNGAGQLGDGTTTQRNSPVPVSGFGPGSGVVAIAAGSHSMALKSDGSVWAWGSNAAGQLGDGTFNQKTVPGQVSDPSGSGFLTGASAIAAGPLHSMALKSDGSVLAWGSNATGQLGDGTNTQRTIPVHVIRFSSGSGAVKIAAGFGYSATLKSDGSVLAWGMNSTGQLGRGTFDGTPPLPIEGITGITAITAGGGAVSPSHNLALKSDGSVFAWGAGNSGQLGNGTSSSQIFPAQVSGLGTGSGVVKIAAGGAHSLALQVDFVLAWGLNTNGQVGDGTTFNRLTPVQVSGLPFGIVAVAAGGAFSVALGSDGTVWTWGLNTNGQLGDGTTTQRTTAVIVNSLGPGSGVIAIAAGGSHTLALKSDGTVWTWGLNSNGQLGDGTTTQATSPLQVLAPSGTGQLTGVTAIAAGGSHSLAAKSDGTVFAWGLNSSGQLGNGASTQQPLPVQVSVLGPGSGVINIAGGGSHSMALKSDGSVWTWGSNSIGQLGDGTLESRPIPIASLVTEAVAISGGFSHSLALASSDIPPAPPGATAISFITPSSGAPGDTVFAIVSGTNLGGAFDLTFSGAGVTGSIGQGGTDTSLPVTIVVAAGAAAGTRTVTVSAAGGTSPAFSGFVVTASGSKKRSGQITSQ